MLKVRKLGKFATNAWHKRALKRVVEDAVEGYFVDLTYIRFLNAMVADRAEPLSERLCMQANDHDVLSD